MLDRIKEKKVRVLSRDFTFCIQRDYENGEYRAWFKGLRTVSRGETPTAAEKTAVADLKMNWFEYKRSIEGEY